MKLLPILLLIGSCPVHSILAQTNHAYQSQKLPSIKTDSLVFEKTNSKKGKSIAVRRGTQIKAKYPKNSAIKGFIHTFSSDSITLITKKGLQSLKFANLKSLVVFYGLRKQTISSEMISKGTLIAVPATLGFALAVRESIADGDLEKQLYQVSAILAFPATALIIAGSLIRRKKLNLTKWSIPPD